jgi:hypothetical protein
VIEVDFDRDPLGRDMLKPCIWVPTICLNLRPSYVCLKEITMLISTLKVEAVYSSETLVTICQIIWRHNQEDRHKNLCLRRNLSLTGVSLSCLL